MPSGKSQISHLDLLFEKINIHGSKKTLPENKSIILKTGFEKPTVLLRGA